MKITIKRSDWKPNLSYDLSCDCLLARAINRQLKTHSAFVRPKEVEACGKYYTYDRVETRLKRAHKNPSLLPITIKLVEEAASPT